jgi:hypothetical protein
VTLNDDNDLPGRGAILDVELEESGTVPAEDASEEDKFFFGTAFEKVAEFDHHLDDPNPWHPDSLKPLFPSQIIGFRWMMSRHRHGRGLIGDKVGYGKVLSQTGNSN